MPKVKSVIVIDYYEGILGLLKSREEFPYNDFLANPRLRTQTDITWSTDSFTERPKLLVDLDGVLKDRYAFALKERITSIESLIELLKEEEGGAPLSELLSKSISYIDERSVYCGDGNVVVVNWGLIPRRPDLGSSSIYRSGKFVASWDKLHKNPDIVRPNAESPKEVDIKPVQEIVTEPEPTGQQVPDIIDEPSPSVQEAVTITEHNDIESDIKPAREESAPQLQETKVEEIPAESKEDEPEKSKKQEESQKKKEEKPKNNDEYTWDTFFSNLWKGIKFFFRKLWWLVLLPLLFLLLLAALFLFKGCQGPISQVNPFYNPLPENPRVLPIEDGKVGLSADGKTQIATDRLNILLEKTNDNTMLEWAKAFKKAYPDEEFEIFYYNKEFYNLQIKVPSEQREQVKNEIKEKLNGFSFDVYDEMVFESDATSFNDPELTNDMHNWYLSAIGAFDAWDITLGDSDILVAIVDNGFDLTHPELQGKIEHPYNVLTRDTQVRPVVTNNGEDSHGTHVAGTAVGNCNNGTGLMGIAPNCRFMPVQVANDNPTGSMSNQAVMEGVMYAINQGADVINLSLGIYLPDGVSGMSESEQLNYISSSYIYEEQMWSKIFEKAKQRNSIIVFAAGNDNVVSGIDPKKRCNETIRVSALNTGLTKADFSNFGVYPQLNRTYSTISAPGVSIYSAAPHDSYTILDGTSMAAPVVTGAVALLKSIDKSLTVNDITKILQETGKNVGTNIGPMLQLKKALLKAKGETDEAPVNCEEISKKIRQLKMEIDSLKKLCPDSKEQGDTLKYEDAIKDKHGLDGLWKSTTSLVSTTDNTPVELYMRFKKDKGTLIIKNKGYDFTAPLKVHRKKNNIEITQLEEAKSNKSDITFDIYRYECSEDRKGNFMCQATSASNSVSFYLTKIK